MSDLRKAAEMALEALEDVPLKPTEWSPAVEALRQALAQPEWVGLDEDRVDYLADKYAPPIHPAFQNDDDYWKFYQEIEAELKEKNT